MYGAPVATRVGTAIAIALIVVTLLVTAITVAGGQATDRDADAVPILSGSARRPPTGDLLLSLPQSRGASQLFVVPVDGTDPHPLIPGDVVSGIQAEAAWSPDGSQVAFTVQEGSARDIYVVNADGTNLRQLAPVDRSIQVPPDWVISQQSPAWSPDGTAIAFSSNQAVDHGGQDIYVVNADGSNLRRLTDDAIWEFSPRWSPDGSQIAIEAYDPGSRGDYGRIYVMNADGSYRRRLTELTGARDPNWSPDGQSIAFTAGRISSTLHLVRADGSDARELSPTSMTARWPRWSPNGSMLAWTAHDAGGSLDGVVVLDVRAGTTRHVSILSGVIEWSGDGEWIAIAVPEINPSGQETGQGGLYLIRPDGSEQIAMMDIALDEYDVMLDWSGAAAN